MDRILDTMEYVQFGEVANFIDRMAAAKAIPLRICPDTLPSAESFWPADGWPKADSLEEKRYAGMLSA